MLSELLYVAVSRINERTPFRCEQVNEDLFEGFEALEIELDIKRLFQWYWFSEDADVGPVIYSSENILTYEKTNGFLKSGIIQIGECPNGDEVFLRFKDFAVLYWSHDENEEESRDEKSFFLVYPRIEQLMVSISNQDLVPWDSYSGREYNQLYYRP